MVTETIVHMKVCLCFSELVNNGISVAILRDHITSEYAKFMDYINSQFVIFQHSRNHCILVLMRRLATNSKDSFGRVHGIFFTDYLLSPL